jgi:Ca-activated chloride channel homolog
MKRTAVLLSLLLAFVTFSFAQSGRRVKTVPVTPPPVTGADDEGQYSESKTSSGPTYSRRTANKAKTPEKEVRPADTKMDKAEDVGDDTIKVETNLVSIPVSVYERSGVYVGGLRRNDFKIFEDGKEQELAYFGTTEVPFSVVLLIDTSPSTQFKIEDIQNAAIDFVRRLDPTDKVMVIEFNSGVDVRADFTNDRAQLERAIRKIGWGGGTALYQAVETALKKKLSTIEGRKAVVLFTDGVDTVSRSSGYENTLALAEEGDSVFFPIYYNTYLDMKGIGTGGVMQTPPTLGLPQGQMGPSSADYLHGRSYLEELARVTGGRMFRPDSTTGGLGAAFQGIVDELRSQYILGYYPNDPGNPGQRKQIKVRVNRAAVAVRARDNYIVGATPVSPKPASK